MLVQLSEQIGECYRHAEKARRMANSATNPNIKADFLDVERRWLFLAHRYELSDRLQHLNDRWRKRTVP